MMEGCNENCPHWAAMITARRKAMDQLVRILDPTPEQLKKVESHFSVTSPRDDTA